MKEEREIKGGVRGYRGEVRGGKRAKSKVKSPLCRIRKGDLSEEESELSEVRTRSGMRGDEGRGEGKRGERR